MWRTDTPTMYGNRLDFVRFYHGNFQRWQWQKSRQSPFCRCRCDRKTTSSSKTVVLVRSNLLHPYSLLLCLCNLTLPSLQTEPLKLASKNHLQVIHDNTVIVYNRTKGIQPTKTWPEALLCIWKGGVCLGLARKRPWRLQKLRWRGATFYRDTAHADSTTQQSNILHGKPHLLHYKICFYNSGRMGDFYEVVNSVFALTSIASFVIVHYHAISAWKSNCTQFLYNICFLSVEKLPSLFYIYLLVSMCEFGAVTSFVCVSIKHILSICLRHIVKLLQCIEIFVESHGFFQAKQKPPSSFYISRRVQCSSLVVVATFLCLSIKADCPVLTLSGY